jgi:hypothetical protein
MNHDQYYKSVEGSRKAVSASAQNDFEKTTITRGNSISRRARIKPSEEKLPIMKKFIILSLLLLVSGLGFSQTTVNLEDQCNCEVLSGTEVTAPGATTPSGADIGDIYVNTNIGTIYFWDGDSWELTSVDTNTTNVSLAVSGADLVLTDSDGNTVSIPLADIDNQTAAEVSYENTTSGLTATDVQEAIDEINDLAGRVALVDNGDGTYLFTDAGGNTTTISDTSISTLVDNGDGSFTYTSEDGTVTTFTETLSPLTDNGDGTFTYTDGIDDF